ncbi:hypothetical protein EII12_04995 [Buchananella hordeovulneris]|nr:hypothetical protein EII12_04995 [Buchananella hordeovulneris]
MAHSRPFFGSKIATRCPPWAARAPSGKDVATPVFTIAGSIGDIAPDDKSLSSTVVPACDTSNSVVDVRNAESMRRAG